MAQKLLRPPGAASEKEFLALCIQCGQCMAACPHNSIKPHRSFNKNRHSMEIEPAKTPCYLCMKCPPVCPTSALNEKCTDMRQANMGQAYILEKHCHNFNNGVMCSTCYDRCPLRGHAMVLELGFIPRHTDACVGCGVCEYVCPVNAIVTIASPSFESDISQEENLKRKSERNKNTTPPTGALKTLTT